MKNILTFLAIAVVGGIAFDIVAFALLYFLFAWPLLFITTLAGLAIACFVRGVGSNPPAEDNGW